MIITGLIGIWKYKIPKFNGNSGFAAEIRLYFTFYALVILGIIFFIIEFYSDKQTFNKQKNPTNSSDFPYFDYSDNNFDVMQTRWQFQPFCKLPQFS